MRIGMCEIPIVTSAPSTQPINEPAMAINAPCHKKIDEISARR